MRYLVIVRAEPTHPTVQWVRATGHQDAAVKCNVPAGGTAEVAAEEHVQVFMRATQAPLLPRDQASAA